MIRSAANVVDNYVAVKLVSTEKWFDITTNSLHVGFNLSHSLFTTC